ncbi:MAG: flavin-nucleotide-binding protein [Deltaproteobacteria bacterium]|jgi:hypothetical protein|nr:flavin-nucleotide-binding protein [Deltaproteobacteria bacterium]
MSKPIPDAYPTSPRSELKRAPERGRTDRATVHAILDEGLVAHVGFATGPQPFVIPSAYVRIGDVLYLHGSPAGRKMRQLGKGIPVCVTVTHVDGLVLGRSALHHSMNYRSVVIFGSARPVDDLEEKKRVLEALVEHVVPGRAAEAREPNETELKFTRVLALTIEEATAKVRTGPPRDDEEDLGHPIWAGVIPLSLAAGDPVTDPRLPAVEEAPSYAKEYRRGPSPPLE